jgi:hypothetical protein
LPPAGSIDEARGRKLSSDLTRAADAVYYIYCTGWNEHRKRGELLLASGQSLETLEKRGIALPSTPEYTNPKEAEIVQVVDGEKASASDFTPSALPENDVVYTGLAVVYPTSTRRHLCVDDLLAAHRVVVPPADEPHAPFTHVKRSKTAQSRRRSVGNVYFQRRLRSISYPHVVRDESSL